MKSLNKIIKSNQLVGQTQHSRLSEIGEILANGINRLLIKETKQNRESSLDSKRPSSVHSIYNNFK
jgi:hypothetical protein